MSRNINDEDDVDDGLILFLLDLCSNIKACLLKVAADIYYYVDCVVTIAMKAGISFTFIFSSLSLICGRVNDRRFYDS